MTARPHIESTLYRYAWGFDSTDLELLGSCFTENAEVVLGENTIAGRAAITEFYTARRARRADAGEQTRHLTTNVYIESESDERAHVITYYTLTVRSSAGLSIGSTGVYEDDFVFDSDGQWRIQRRRTRGDQ